MTNNNGSSTLPVLSVSGQESIGEAAAGDAVGDSGESADEAAELSDIDSVLLVLSVLNDAPMHTDTLHYKTGLPIGRVMASLLLLELSGLAYESYTCYYQRTPIHKELANQRVPASKDKRRARGNAASLAQESIKGGQKSLETKEQTLGEVRRSHRFKQRMLAKRLNMDQADVSRLERRQDAPLSLIRKYVEAMDGRLEVIARFPDSSPVRLWKFCSE
jgi:DNA-binding transcriptional regulator YiaG